MSVVVFDAILLCVQALYTASVPEDIPVNRVIVGVGASDADVGVSAWIQYSLHGPGSEDFSIDPDTGTLPLLYFTLANEVDVCVILTCLSSFSVQAN